MPGQSVEMLGVEVEIAAVFFLGFTIWSILRRVAPGLGLAPRSRARALSEWVGGSVWIVLFMVSGLRLLLRTGGGLYLLAIVMVFMSGWNAYNAWALIAEVSD